MSFELNRLYISISAFTFLFSHYLGFEINYLKLGNSVLIQLTRIPHLN